MEKRGSQISDLPHNIFANIPHKEKKMKERLNKWDYTKLKSFFMAKGIIIKMKREPIVWENMFANDTSDKGLTSKIHKQLICLNRKTNNQIKKWAKDLSRCFSKEDIRMAHRHMERCSTSLAIRKIQIKTTMRYHLIPVRIAIINKSTNNKC